VAVTCVSLLALLPPRNIAEIFGNPVFPLILHPKGQKFQFHKFFKCLYSVVNVVSSMMPSLQKVVTRMLMKKKM